MSAWQINRKTLGLERMDGEDSYLFTAQNWRDQAWPLCPVCDTVVDVAQIDVRTVQDPAPVYMVGPWQCPNACDPRPALRTETVSDT